MLSKPELYQLKTKNLPRLYKILEESKDNHEVLFILENLGYLPSNFDGDRLLSFLDHSNDAIRFWAVKNLGKLGKEKYLEPLCRVAEKDLDSMVRREAVSSIGRMRCEKTIPSLIGFLDNPDPKIVLQAIRALLVFRRNAQAQVALRRLRNHPNEMVQAVIAREFSNQDNGPGNGTSPTHVHDFLKNVIVLGDVREVMRFVPDDSVHLTFTSPPYYNARDYSIYPSYQAYLDFLAEVFAEVHRITKEGRFFILNTSPVIVPRISRAHASKRYPIPFDIHPRLVEMGWEFIDDIVWLKPEASVKNRNAGFLQHRKPLAYKPNPVTEYLMVYRKKTEKLLDWNMRAYDFKIVEQSRVRGNYETSNVWRIDPTFDRVHSAVFPIELCNRVITFYSFKGDLVFDPFGGSGTLGKAAQNLERYFLLAEKEERYVQRMKEDLSRQNLFGDRAVRFLSLEQFRQQTEMEKSQ